jgi:hypothetical protein
LPARTSLRPRLSARLLAGHRNPRLPAGFNPPSQDHLRRQHDPSAAERKNNGKAVFRVPFSSGVAMHGAGGRPALN